MAAVMQNSPEPMDIDSPSYAASLRKRNFDQFESSQNNQNNQSNQIRQNNNQQTYQNEQDVDAAQRATHNSYFGAFKHHLRALATVVARPFKRTSPSPTLAPQFIQINSKRQRVVPGTWPASPSPAKRIPIPPSKRQNSLQSVKPIPYSLIAENHKNANSTTSQTNAGTSTLTAAPTHPLPTQGATGQANAGNPSVDKASTIATGQTNAGTLTTHHPSTATTSIGQTNAGTLTVDHPTTATIAIGQTNVGTPITHDTSSATTTTGQTNAGNLIIDHPSTATTTTGQTNASLLNANRPTTATSPSRSRTILDEPDKDGFYSHVASLRLRMALYSVTMRRRRRKGKKVPQNIFREAFRCGWMAQAEAADRAEAEGAEAESDREDEEEASASDSQKQDGGVLEAPELPEESPALPITEETTLPEQAAEPATSAAVVPASAPANSAAVVSAAVPATPVPAIPTVASALVAIAASPTYSPETMDWEVTLPQLGGGATTTESSDSEHRPRSSSAPAPRKRVTWDGESMFVPNKVFPTSERALFEECSIDSPFPEGFQAFNQHRISQEAFGDSIASSVASPLSRFNPSIATPTRQPPATPRSTSPLHGLAEDFEEFDITSPGSVKKLQRFQVKEAEQARLAAEKKRREEQARKAIEAKKLEEQRETERIEREREEAAREAEREAGRAAAAAIAAQRIINDVDSEWDRKINAAVAIKDYTRSVTPALTRKDIGSLIPTLAIDRYGWLNDEVVNTYLSSITDKVHEQTQYTKKSDRIPPVQVLSSHLYSTYQKKGYKGVERWALRAKIAGNRLLSCDTILIPINTGVHWTLLSISGTARTVSYYDSLGGTGAHYTSWALQWLADNLGTSFQRDEWSIQAIVPQHQENSNDCGVFVCLNGHALLAGRDPAQAYQAGEVKDAGRRAVAAVLLGRAPVV